MKKTQVYCLLAVVIGLGVMVLGSTQVASATGWEFSLEQWSLEGASGGITFTDNYGKVDYSSRPEVPYAYVYNLAYRVTDNSDEYFDLGGGLILPGTEQESSLNGFLIDMVLGGKFELVSNFDIYYGGGAGFSQLQQEPKEEYLIGYNNKYPSVHSFIGFLEGEVGAEIDFGDLDFFVETSYKTLSYGSWEYTKENYSDEVEYGEFPSELVPYPAVSVSNPIFSFGLNFDF